MSIILPIIPSMSTPDTRDENPSFWRAKTDMAIATYQSLPDLKTLSLKWSMHELGVSVDHNCPVRRAIGLLRQREIGYVSDIQRKIGQQLSALLSDRGQRVTYVEQGRCEGERLWHTESNTLVIASRSLTYIADFKGQEDVSHRYTASQLLGAIVRSEIEAIIAFYGPSFTDEVRGALPK